MSSGVACAALLLSRYRLLRVWCVAVKIYGVLVEEGEVEEIHTSTYWD